jgi:hypothetical protein
MSVIINLLQMLLTAFIALNVRKRPLREREKKMKRRRVNESMSAWCG